MTDKEKNRAIYDRLLELACEMWESVKQKAPEGSYTAMQVHELLPTIEVGDACVEMEVRVDNFRCTFLSTDVFRLLHQFAKLAGVKREETKKFIYAQECEAELSALIRIDNRHKQLKKMMVDDKSRPVLGSVYVDMQEGYMVTTDGHVLGAMKVDGLMNKGEFNPDPGFCMPPSILDKKGLANIFQYQGRRFGYHSICGERGTIEVDGRFPNWKSVVPNVSEERHYVLEKDSLTQLKKFLKGVIRMKENDRINGTDAHVVELYCESESRVLHAEYKDWEEHTASIALPMQQGRNGNMEIVVCAEWLMKLMGAWNGSFWARTDGRAIVFDSKDGDTLLLMPCRLNGSHYGYTKDNISFDIPWRERYGKIKTETIKTITIMGYPINVLAAGTYEVRGQKQENLTADIRKMAAYVMEHEEVMRKCQDYFTRTYGRGAEAQKHYPLPEQEIHDMMRASLLEQGIDLCPRQTYSSPTPSTDEPIHLEPGSTVCITGTLLHSRKHYETEIADRGWTFAPRLTKAVDLLVCADDSAESMSGKVKKAMEFGTRTCTAQQFYDLLERTPILKQETKHTNRKANIPFR